MLMNETTCLWASSTTKSTELSVYLVSLTVLIVRSIFIHHQLSICVHTYVDKCFDKTWKWIVVIGKNLDFKNWLTNRKNSNELIWITFRTEEIKFVSYYTVYIVFVYIYVSKSKTSIFVLFSMGFVFLLNKWMTKYCPFVCGKTHT